jgi:hypothetical protein
LTFDQFFPDQFSSQKLKQVAAEDRRFFSGSLKKSVFHLFDDDEQFWLLPRSGVGQHVLHGQVEVQGDVLDLKKTGRLF